MCHVCGASRCTQLQYARALNMMWPLVTSPPEHPQQLTLSTHALTFTHASAHFALKTP